MSHLVNDYIELTKPRITWLILMSTAAGYYFGHHGAWQLYPIVHTLFGTALIASGTAALNQWYVPHWLGTTGSIYLVGALALGLCFLYSGIRVSFDRTRIRARHVVLASVVYLPLLCGLMVLDPVRL